jgi:hypothetical protein
MSPNGQAELNRLIKPPSQHAPMSERHGIQRGAIQMEVNVFKLPCGEPAKQACAGDIATKFHLMY